LTRQSIKSKPLRCQECEQLNLELVYYKKEWVCPKCLNKTEEGEEPKLEKHLYSGRGPEW